MCCKQFCEVLKSITGTNYNKNTGADIMSPRVKGNPMRCLRVMATILILLVTGFGRIFASDVVPAKLSIADAIKIALTCNVDIKTAKSNLLTSSSRLRIAELQTTYSVGANTTLEHTPGESGIANSVFGGVQFRSFSGTEMSLDVSPFGTGSEPTSLDLTLRHPLTYRRGLLSEKADIIQTARSQMTIAERQAFQTQQSTVLSVVRAYFRAVEAREQVKVQERALALIEQAARDAKRREEAGFARGIDVYRAEVQVQQTRERLNVRRESAKAALDQLMLAIGVGVGATPELIDAIPEVKPELPSLEDAISKALKNRAELVVYDERLTTQARQVSIAEEALKTRIDAVMRFRSSSPENLISASMLEEGSSAIGLEIRVPIDRRAIREERDIATRELNILREERAFREEQIAEEVRSAYRSLESAATSLEILAQNLEVAKKNLLIAERMVEEGEADNRDVLSAQESLASAESGMLSAKVDLYLASLELNYAIGEDLTKVSLQ